MSLWTQKICDLKFNAWDSASRSGIDPEGVNQARTPSNLLKIFEIECGEF
jgi:hypothetical protein